MNPFENLSRFVMKLPFEEYDGSQLVDSQGHYQWKLPGDFPFALKLLSFDARKPNRPLTWHDYLEIFIPLEGSCRMLIGGSTVDLSAGDLLVIDNLKLHALVDFSGSRMRAIVIRFSTDLIYCPGSFSVDRLFCMPFYHQLQGQPYVVRRNDTIAPRMYAASTQMLECFFDKAGPPYSQAGTKVFFLELLYHLTCRFRVSEKLHWEYLLHRERSQRLQKLFDYVGKNFENKISLGQAAALVGMSRRSFLTVFKAVAGIAWVDYLNDVRLTNGAQLLKETNFSIAEIAYRVGYADQSYFNRRFKRRFGVTPVQFRARGALNRGGAATA